ncbi:MAG: ketoacyl-ACP synthase III [Sphingomonadales bacterium]|nr:ketoacyl-ACP synthase III [Sphingomonadales bacterium]
MKRSKILGVGHFVPDHVVTNHDLSQLMETSHEWVVERTGIEERRHIVPGGGDTTATMGYKASLMALKNAGIRAENIDFIIFATLSPDYYFPGSGVQLQEMLSPDHTIGALDIRNQCSGFVYALSVADQFIRTGMYRRILVVGSEVHSAGLDMTTRGRNVSVIFGDGAGAVVVGVAEENGDASTDGNGILSTHLHSEGRHARELAVISPSTQHWISHILNENNPDDESYYPYMNGNFVFKHAITRFSEVIKEALEANGIQAGDLKLMIPHQANLRISQYIQQKIGLRDDQVYNNIMRYGNTTAASIPIALSEAVAEGRLQRGDLLMLAAFGSGFTWASALIRW